MIENKTIIGYINSLTGHPSKKRIMLHEGLYEQVINKELDTELAATDRLCQTAPIDSAEAAKNLSAFQQYH